jgi:MFS transporter, ACS family, D-galactonate transporter
MQVTEQGIPTSEHADRGGRWPLLMLLLFAIALGCYQQGEMSILLVFIREQLKLSFIDIGSIFFSFNLASTAGFLLMAVFIWRERGWTGYAVLGSLGVLGALLTGASSGVGGLIVARGITGLAYGGLLVGAYRIVGGWLPPESHGLATGLLFAVAQSMRLLTPVITADVTPNVGWRWPSLVVAVLWFIWVLLWIWRLRRSWDTLHPEQPRGLVTLAQMFKDRVTWVVVVGVALASPLLSFQSGRLLGHLHELAKATGPAAVWEFMLVEFLPATGAVAAGLISDTLIRKGWSAGKSRALLVTICGLLMSFPALFAFSSNAVFHLPFAILSVTAGQSLFAVLYAALVDAVPGRGIILGVGLSRWLSGLMGNVANIMTEPVTSRLGSGPLVIGFSILALITIICVRPLTRRSLGN